MSVINLDVIKRGDLVQNMIVPTSIGKVVDIRRNGRGIVAINGKNKVTNLYYWRKIM